MALGKKCEDLKMLMYWDAVLNHKTGGDKTEKVMIREVAQDGRLFAWNFYYFVDIWQITTKSSAITAKLRPG